MSRIWIVGLTLLLGACGWFKRGDDGIFLNPKDDYLASVQHNELVVPEDLRDLQNTDPFPIPPTPEPPNPSYYPERPPRAGERRVQKTSSAAGHRQMNSCRPA